MPTLFVYYFFVSIQMFSKLTFPVSVPKKISLPVRRNAFGNLAISHKPGNRGVRVVTDIDDTVKSSGGVKLLGIALGGIDTHYKRGDFYPGAFQFAFELSSNSSMKKKENSIPARVAVLTARAREFKFALALKPGDKLCSQYERTGKSNGVDNWGVGDVYYGSVAEWIFQERKGVRKFKNFEILMDDDRSKGRSDDYVLVGDTGEKDEEAGERIAMHYPHRLRAIFLHAVSETKDRSLITLPKDREINGVPIFYFRTYAGAALKAMQAGLIGSAAISRVVEQARRDLARKEPLSLGLTTVERSRLSTRWKELEEDIASLKATPNIAMTRNPALDDLFAIFDMMSKSK